MQSHEVSSAVYFKFYDILSHQIFNNFCKDLKHIPTIGKRLMWTEAYFPKKPPVNASCVLFDTKSADYFYRKNQEAKSKKQIILDCIPFYKALEYIGIFYPEGTPPDIELSPKRRCEILYNQFCLLYPEAQTFEEKTEFSDVEGTLIHFYEYIGINNLLSEAWKLLTTDFQMENFGGDFKAFELGYTNCKGIRNLSIFNITPISPSTLECMIYYEDEIQAYSSFELSSIGSLLVRDRKELFELLDKMVEKAKALNIDSIEDIEIHKLFDAVASEYIWYKCKFSEPQFKFFSIKKTEIVKRLYQCKCKLIDDKWHIDRLRKLTTYSSR